MGGERRMEEEGKKQQVRNQSSASQNWPRWQYIPTPSAAPTPGIMHQTSNSKRPRPRIVEWWLSDSCPLSQIIYHSKRKNQGFQNLKRTRKTVGKWARSLTKTNFSIGAPELVLERVRSPYLKWISVGRQEFILARGYLPKCGPWHMFGKTTNTVELQLLKPCPLA